MRNLSVITLVSLFFAFTLGVINLALVLEYKRQVTERQTFAFQRFMMGTKMLHDTSQDKTNINLESLHVKISQIPTSLLLDKGIILFEDPFHSLISFNKKLYFAPNLLPPPPPSHQKNPMHPPLTRIVLEDTIDNTVHHVFMLGIVINGLLLIFFSVVLRKLLGLKNLKNAIKHFRESPVSGPIILESSDELGQIANEFNITMDKIHHLKEARTLFLRNILHELKTPIMKGKIISEQIEKVSSKTALLRVFMRLEGLLEESVKMEKLTSNEWHLQLEEYRLVDVLDHAIDLLMIETSKIQVKGRTTSGLVKVDFELFATAMKNLIDNALRHSQNEVEITLEKYQICFVSLGQILSKEQLDFSRAFNRAQEGASTGLGLGLYIANAIVKKHGFSLKYHHLGGKNWFCIQFGKNEKNT
jgi:two-component system OmpR family sensor kinase